PTRTRRFLMLDAFKNIANLKGQFVQQQTELETLIATAREERSGLSAMLSSLTTRSANLLPMGKSLELVSDRATSITTRLNDISKRLVALDGRAKELETVEKRIQALKETVLQAERNTQKVLGSEGQLYKHREAVQQLSAQALQTQASLDTLKKERLAFEELRGQFRTAEAEVKQSINQAGTLKGELDQ